MATTRASSRAGRRPARSASEIPSAIAALPLRQTSFVGRTAELALIEQRLADAAAVTLTGAAGVGKTRLALEAAGHASEGRDVRYVDVAAVRVAERVPSAIAAALDARESREVDFIGASVAAVRRQAVLLVLDNCEHLVSAVAGVAAALVARCPSLTVLATSRIPLRISGEAVIPVQPLPITPDATTLFCDRARMAAPGFEPSAVPADAVGEICRRLGGLPLAVELAAAWTLVMSPGELLRLLRSRFDVLVGGENDGDARHGTLRAAVDWSYNLLPQEARALFRRLSVFRGSFTRDAAEAVWGGDASGPVLPTLAALCETSLVVVESGASGRNRYRLLDTLREYGAGRLREDAGEERAVRDRQLMYLVELAEQSFAQRMDGGSAALAAVLEQYRADVRLALDWAATTDPDLQLRLAGTLAEDVRWALFNRAETRRVLGEALARSTKPSAPRARALVGAGYMALLSEDETAAQEFVEEACALYQRLGDRAGEAWAHLALGHIAWMQDDLNTASYHLSQSRAMYTEDGSTFGANRALLRQGIAEAFVEDPAPEAVAHLMAAAAASDATGDTFGSGLARTALGWTLMQHGRAGDARAMLQEAVRGLHAANEPMVFAAIETLAVHHADDAGEAMRLLGYARGLRQQHGLRPLHGPAVTHREERALEERARSVLGREEAARADTEGRTMAADEAVALALNLGGSTPPRPQRSAYTPAPVRSP